MDETETLLLLALAVLVMRQRKTTPAQTNYANAAAAAAGLGAAFAQWWQQQSSGGGYTFSTPAAQPGDSNFVGPLPQSEGTSQSFPPDEVTQSSNTDGDTGFFNIST